MRYLLAIIPLFMLTGCAMDNYTKLIAKTEVNNYRDRLVVTHYDNSFYKLNDSSVANSCFPLTDATSINCVMPDIATASKSPIKMTSFQFGMTDRRGYVDAKFNELLFMAISDVALSKGFSKFTITTIDDEHGCSSSPTVNSYGTVTGNTYSTTTYSSSNTVCSDLQTSNVLFFDNPVELAQGIVAGSTLVSELYRGALPTTMKMFSGPTEFPGSSWTVPYKAWRTYYNAAGLSAELHKKYGVTDTTTYHIIEHGAESKAKAVKDAANPINKYKTTQ
jgi:hypothetical protein